MNVSLINTEIKPFKAMAYHKGKFVVPPQRRVALAWRISFPRPQAIEALRRAIRACALDCVSYLVGRAG